MENKNEYKITLKKVLKHTKLVLTHKWIVFKLCCKVGEPWRGFMHDWSKFSPTEFWESVRYYTGVQSPIHVCRKVNGYSKAWVHHKAKNRHHTEYWIDFLPQPTGVMMPYKFVAEMICDKLAAGIVYEGKNWTNESELKYYLKEREVALIDERIDKMLIDILTQIKDNGIDKALTKKNVKALYEKFSRGTVLFEKKHFVTVDKCEKYLYNFIVTLKTQN